MLTYGRRIPLPELDYRIEVSLYLTDYFFHFENSKSMLKLLKKSVQDIYLTSVQL